jgi:hypothetical protein
VSLDGWMGGDGFSFDSPTLLYVTKILVWNPADDSWTRVDSAP